MNDCLIPKWGRVCHTIYATRVLGQIPLIPHLWLTRLLFDRTRATLTVLLRPPEITTESQDQAVVSGAAATFTVAATGSLPLSYQWQREGVDVVDGGRISGAKTSTLTISELSLGDLGGYSVVVENGLGRTQSKRATIATVGNTPGFGKAGCPQPAPPGGVETPRPTRRPAFAVTEVCVRGFRRRRRGWPCLC